MFDKCSVGCSFIVHLGNTGQMCNTDSGYILTQAAQTLLGHATGGCDRIKLLSERQTIKQGWAIIFPKGPNEKQKILWRAGPKRLN